MEAASLEQVQARHRRELRDLQGRITNKKKNASKKTRKSVNDECAAMERRLREAQAAELASLTGQTTPTPTHSPHRDAAEAGEDEAGEDEDGGAPANGLDKPGPKAEEPRLNDDDDDGGGDGDDDSSSAPGQPGKKRNRQKERLARRAAEQEAAAQRAADEAATMTDHRAREGEYMKSMFDKYGLAEREIEPDGHCLFSAVADQLAQHAIPLCGAAAAAAAPPEPAYKTVRRAAAAYMEENADDFAPFLDEDLETYVARMRDTAEWGGQLELTALAKRYGAEIRVVQDGRTESIGENEGGVATGKTLWLAYYRHGYGLGEHYNSLRKKEAAS
ncbi:OTU domain-containing protein 2 [Tolypocladium capitatum]|uniref:OTU domain-containing protein 2 n=1 Tax=Tolypocladium capitatum TaxID=45235 RepID=A0A2K3Q811_9HYPO|nr:OTU domain-containing protein 2 [Tolypocladium capitatum]